MEKQNKKETMLTSGNIREGMIRLLQDKDTMGIALVVKNKNHTVVMMHEDLKPYDKAVRILAMITEVFAAK